MSLEGFVLPPALIEQQTVSHAQGHSLVLVAIDGAVAGAIELQPTILPEAQAVIQDLHKRGLATVIISGDQAAGTRLFGWGITTSVILSQVNMPVGIYNALQPLLAERKGRQKLLP